MTSRIDLIGQNGPTGEHYDATRAAFDESANFEPAAPKAPKALGGARVSRHVVDGYHGLFDVLGDALDQAQSGKGAERHAQDKPFEEQPMQKLIELHGRGFAYGQAGKKAQESERMEYGPARRELLGAIVYLAGAVINLDKENRNG